MKTVAKIVSVLVMVLSAILFIAMLAGIFGAWWARGQAVTLVTNVAAAGDQALARGQELVVQANGYVVTGQSEVQRVTTGIAAAGAKAEETNLVLAAAEAAFDKDLTPGLQRLNERGQELRATVQLVDQTLSLMQRLPGGRDSKLLVAVDELITTLGEIDRAIKDAASSIQQAKSAGIDRLVTTLTAPLDRVNTALTAVSDRLTLSNQRFEQGRADLVALRDQVNSVITWAAVIGTFALLWMALAQAGLFLHAYGVFTGRDPLARWHRCGEQRNAPVPQPAA
jgi:hypothetical protein